MIGTILVAPSYQLKYDIHFFMGTHHSVASITGAMMCCSCKKSKSTLTLSWHVDKQKRSRGVKI